MRSNIKAIKRETQPKIIKNPNYNPEDEESPQTITVETTIEKVVEMLLNGDALMIQDITSDIAKKYEVK